MTFIPEIMKTIPDTGYGETLSTILVMNRKGKVMSKKETTLSLILKVDGKEYEPIICNTLDINYTSTGVILTANSAMVEVDVPQVENTPSSEGIISSDESEMYFLSGEDLESFESISPLRDKAMLKVELSGTAIPHTLDSGDHNIQEINSVTYAILDLVEKEKEIVDNGKYLVRTIETPTFIYSQDSDVFKLREKVLLVPK